MGKLLFIFYNSVVIALLLAFISFRSVWLEMRVNVGLLILVYAVVIFLIFMFALRKKRGFSGKYKVFAAANLLVSSIASTLVLGIQSMGVVPAAIIREGLKMTHIKFSYINTALPLVSNEDIAMAQQVLSSHDVVLGPSTDGGYWLVGLKQIFPHLFQQTNFGHGQVLEEAQAICGAQGLSVGLTSCKRDIDVWEDIEYFRQMATPRSSPSLYGFLQNLFGVDV